MLTPYRWRRTCLAALSAALFTAAYPPYDLWPLAFVSWVPLLLAIRNARPREAALLGGVQGFLANVGGMAFLPGVIATLGSIPRPLSVAIAILIYAYSAGLVALVAWLTTRARDHGWPEWVSFALALGAGEVFYPVLMPMFTGAQVHRIPLLIQLADIGGTPLVGVPIVLVNVGIAELFAARFERRRVAPAPLAFALAAMTLTVAYGAVRIATIDAHMARAPSARVAIIQGNTPHEGVPVREAITLYRKATAALSDEVPVDLVVWPETAIIKPFVPHELRWTVRERVAHTIEGDPLLKAPVLSGTLIERPSGVANSAILFDPSGEIRGEYDKVHPLVMGEYIPGGEWFPALYKWLPNSGRIRPGADDQAPIEVSGHKLATLICYEDLLAGYANGIVNRNAPELLVNLTNDSWFGNSGAAAEHFALAQFRAVEHRRFLVRSSNSGVSGFVDAVGRSSQETPLLEAATRIGEVRWMNEPTLYEGLGEKPWWLAAALVLFASLVPRRSLVASRRLASAPGLAEGEFT